MKFILAGLLLLSSLFSFSQNDEQKNYLVCYAQVWGFLKYFHPEPSKTDWDNNLITDYEKLINCNSDTAFNKIILNLINQCGDYQLRKRKVADSLIFKESFHWLLNSLIDQNNSSYLNRLFLNKPKFKNKYISKAPSGNPLLTNEVNYGEYTYDPSLQFLALSRYWNVINYFCPNRDIIPANWDNVLKDHITEFITAKSFEEYFYAISHITNKIRDGHGFVLTKSNPINELKRAPFFSAFLEGKYYVSRIYQDSTHAIKIKKGDEIIAIDGLSPEDKMNEISKFLSTSNNYNLSKFSNLLGLTKSDTVIVVVKRQDEILRDTLVTLTLSALNAKNKRKVSSENKDPFFYKTDEVTGKEYCYIHMGSLKREHINKQFKQKLLATENIIIDSRNYPNWTLTKLTDILLKGKNEFAKITAMNLDYPGSFKWIKTLKIGNRNKAYQGGIFVLVDYQTMSQAEYTVMAFQAHPNTIVIGGQTAGADGDVSRIPLPFEVESAFSGLGIFYPNGAPTQQIGIRRDYEVVQNKGLLIGGDLILEKALSLIREQSE